MVGEPWGLTCHARRLVPVMAVSTWDAQACMHMQCVGEYTVQVLDVGG